VLKQNEEWKLPRGRLEENDKTPHEGLLREIREETGIKNCNIEKVLHLKLSESRNTYRVTFLCSTIEELVTLSDEHTEYAWINLRNIGNCNCTHEETKNMVVNFLSIEN
jgi:8-oxo-dGTP pyrophosphatase MutT (NUDIX family)